jgi:hypothetical protein
MTGKTDSWPRLIWSVVALEVGWFACVLGAAWDAHWLGVLVVSLLAVIHGLIIKRDRLLPAILLALASLAVGFVIDTALIAIGAYEPNRWLLRSPIVTVWLLMLWLNFSLALNESLRRLQEHLFAAAILGSIFGPLAYLAASRFGAIRIETPVAGRLLLVSFGWLIAMPLMSAIARKLHQSPYRLRKR